MALAARCPHCRALFRVIADQLKLRGGLVRCGECRHVFDAIGGLSYVEDQALMPERADAPIGGAALPGPGVAQPAVNRPARPRETPRAAAPAAPVPRSARAPRVERRAAISEDEFGAELSVPTLFGVPEAQGEDAAREGQPSGPRIEPFLHSASSRSSAAARSRADNRPGGSAGYAALTQQDEAEPAPVEEEEAEAPSFLPTEDQQRERRLRRVLAAACVPLALLAALQILLALRDSALQTWPSLRPLLVSACHAYGCTVTWPEHAELLTIVGSELAAIPGTDVIELNAAIRSRAPFTMALPAIEVTLTDTQNRTIARKVFLPVDYLAANGEPSSRIEEGLAPGSDLSVRLVFEARGLNASGFVLYPFYL